MRGMRMSWAALTYMMSQCWCCWPLSKPQCSVSKAFVSILVVLFIITYNKMVKMNSKKKFLPGFLKQFEFSLDVTRLPCHLKPLWPFVDGSPGDERMLVTLSLWCNIMWRRPLDSERKTLAGVEVSKSLWSHNQRWPSLLTWDCFDWLCAKLWKVVGGETEGLAPLQLDFNLVAICGP